MIDTLPLDFLHPAWPLSPRHAAPQHAPLPHFFSLHEETLEDILDRPHSLFLETGERRRVAETVDYILAGMPDFALSLSTPTAWHKDIAHITARVLNEHFGLQEAKAMQITTCLQEAVSNAIVHGNLGLRSDFFSLDDMQRHYAIIEDRIGKALYKGTRVNILAWERGSALELAVSDSGSGFSLPAISADDFPLPHGRGLLLIQSLASRTWIDSDGKSLHMIFAYQE